MKKEYNTFYTIVMHYIDDEELFLSRLQNFIEHYEIKNYEYALVQLAIEKSIGTKSLVETFKDVLLANEDNYQTKVKGSTNKMIFDFYLVILLQVYEGFSLLSFCYMLEEEITQSIKKLLN